MNIKKTIKNTCTSMLVFMVVKSHQQLLLKEEKQEKRKRVSIGPTEKVGVFPLTSHHVPAPRLPVKAHQLPV